MNRRACFLRRRRSGGRRRALASPGQGRRRDPRTVRRRQTWLTYAVNVEMTWSRPARSSTGSGRSRRPASRTMSSGRGASKDIDAIAQAQPRAGADAGPVLGLAGEGVRPRDHQSRPGTARGIRGGDPVGRPRRQEAGRQEALRRGRRGDRGPFARRADRRPSSPPSRRARRSSSPRGSRSSSSRSTSWSTTRGSSSSLGPRREDPQGRRLAERQDALRHLPPADQRGEPHGQHPQVQRPDRLLTSSPTIPAATSRRPARSTMPYVLRTIHDVGYRDAIGLEMSPKGDPMAGVPGHPAGRRRGPLPEADRLTEPVGSSPDAMADVLRHLRASGRASSTSTSARSARWRSAPRPWSWASGSRSESSPTSGTGRCGSTRGALRANVVDVPILDFSATLWATNSHPSAS